MRFAACITRFEISTCFHPPSNHPLPKQYAWIPGHFTATCRTRNRKITLCGLTMAMYHSPTYITCTRVPLYLHVLSCPSCTTLKRTSVVLSILYPHTCTFYTLHVACGFCPQLFHQQRSKGSNSHCGSGDSVRTFVSVHWTDSVHIYWFWKRFSGGPQLASLHGAFVAYNTNWN